MKIESSSEYPQHIVESNTTYGASTEHGNRRLNEAFKEQQGAKAPIFLLFSVNGSSNTN